MIKSSAITDLLKRTVENEIDMVFISRLTGEILGCEKKGEAENDLIPDILSSIISSYIDLGKEQNENLSTLFIENEDSNIVCSPIIYDYFLAMKAKNTMPLGKLKAHLNTLKNNIEKAMDPYKKKLVQQKKDDE